MSESGTSGSVPKGSDQQPHPRRSPRAAPLAKAIEQPPLTASPHALAAEWYRSLAEPGQAAFYEPSDWAAAQVVAFDLTRHLNGRRVSAQVLTAVGSATRHTHL